MRRMLSAEGRDIMIAKINRLFNEGVQVDGPTAILEIPKDCLQSNSLLPENDPRCTEFWLMAYPEESLEDREVRRLAWTRNWISSVRANKIN